MNNEQNTKVDWSNCQSILSFGTNEVYRINNNKFSIDIPIAISIYKRYANKGFTFKEISDRYKAAHKTTDEHLAYILAQIRGICASSDGVGNTCFYLNK